MQRITSAYANKDLLSLLELYFEVEQIDQSSINTISNDRIAHYNKILADQVSELTREIIGIKSMLQMKFPALSDLYSKLNSRRMMESLHKEIAIINHHIAVISKDILSFMDKANIKAFLRSYSLKRHEDFMCSAMDDFF